LNGDAVSVPNFHISFLFRVNAIEPSGLESATGVCIKPI